MIKKLLGLALVIVMISVADAAVVWDYTGAGSTDPLDWYDNGNWTVTGTTGYPNNPCEQYSGTAPAVGPPDYRYINDDVTAINIGGGGAGYTVNKTVDDGTTFLTSDCLYMGGSGCTLTLDDASTLNLGGDLYAGVDGATAAVKVLGDSTLNFVEGLVGNAGSTGSMTVDNSTIYSPSSTGNNSTGELLVGNGAGATGSLELKNGTVANVGGWMRVGCYSTTAHGELTVTDSTLTLCPTDNANGFLQIARDGYGKMTATNSGISCPREFQIGYSNDSSGEVTLDNSSLSTDSYCLMGRGSRSSGTIALTNNSSLSVGNYWCIGYTDSTSTGQATLTNSSVTVSSYTQIGRYGTNVTLNATGSTMTCVTSGTTSYPYFALCYFGGSATATLDATDLYVGVDNVGTTLNSSADLYVARVGTAQMDVKNGSTVTVADDIFVGVNSGGTGTLNISGGSVVQSGDAIMVGNSAGSTGTLDISGGGVFHSIGRTYVGSSGTGTLDVTDGTLDVGTDLRPGYSATGKGIVNIHPDAIVNVGRDLETCANAVAKSGDGLDARIHMYGGDVNIDGYLCLGAAGQGGSYTEFIMDDGTVDVGLDPPEFDPPREFLDNLFMGWYDTDAQAYLTINGGVMTVAGAISMGSEYNYDGTAVTTTGADQGELRINIAGGILQAEDYVDAGTITDHLITLTAGQLRINGSAVSEAEMAALVALGDISCPNGCLIYTDGDYTVLMIPEPAMLTMVLLGLGGLALMRRRRG